MGNCCRPSLRCRCLLSLWTHIWFHVSEGQSLDTRGQSSTALPGKPPGKKPHAGPGAAQQSSLLLIPSCFLIFYLDIYYRDPGEQPVHALCVWALRWCSFTFCLCCVRLGTSINIFKHMWLRRNLLVLAWLKRARMLSCRGLRGGTEKLQQCSDLKRTLQSLCS